MTACAKQRLCQSVFEIARGQWDLPELRKLLGGYMHIDTAPGEGTHITISIPIDAEGEE